MEDVLDLYSAPGEQRERLPRRKRETSIISEGMYTNLGIESNARRMDRDARSCTGCDCLVSEANKWVYLWDTLRECLERVEHETTDWL